MSTNKKTYKANIVTVIIYSILAIVHDIWLAFNLIQGYSTTSSHFVIFTIATLMWNISAIVWIYRYIKSQKQ